MKKNKLKNLLKCGILICGISLLIFACQKDDDLLKVDDNLAKQNNGNQSHLRAKDIPLILYFVKKETNNTQQVIFDDTNVNKAKQDYRNFNFSARTTSGFGYIDTSNALVVESETVISYTFKVVTKNLTNFINYIVVENKADLEKYGYFMKYTPTTQWIESRLSLSSFSGTVDYYNENEDLQTSLTLTDGNIINFGDNEIPCPEIVFNPFGVGENQSAEDSSDQGGSSIVNEEGTDSNYNPWDTWTTGWFPTDTGSGNGTGGGGGGNEDIGEEEIDEGSSGGKCCKTCEVEPGVGCNHEHHHYNYVNRTGQINLKTTPSVDNPCVHTGVVAFMINQLDFTTQQIDWLTDIEQADIYASLIDYLNLANYNQVAIDNAQDVVETLMENDCEVNPIQEICECLNSSNNIFACIGLLIEHIIDEINCEKLKNLTKTDSLNANVKPIVNSLRLKTTLDKEWSCNYRRYPNFGEFYTSAQDEGIIEGKSLTKSSIYVGTSWIGNIHTHPKDTYPMFSWLDLKAIKNVHKGTSSSSKNDVFVMIVCDNGKVYSIKINDVDTLISALDNDLENAKGNTNKKKEENIEKFLAEEFKKSDNLEQTFLKLYGNHGLSLYKATDVNLSNWTQLELDENDNNTVNETPCN